MPMVKPARVWPLVNWLKMVGFFQFDRFQKELAVKAWFDGTLDAWIRTAPETHNPNLFYIVHTTIKWKNYQHWKVEKGVIIIVFPTAVWISVCLPPFALNDWRLNEFNFYFKSVECVPRISSVWSDKLRPVK